MNQYDVSSLDSCTAISLRNVQAPQKPVPVSSNPLHSLQKSRINLWRFWTTCLVLVRVSLNGLGASDSGFGSAKLPGDNPLHWWTVLALAFAISIGGFCKDLLGSCIFYLGGVWVLTFPNSDSVWSGWPPSRNIGKLKRSSFHKVWQRKVIGMLFHDLPGQWFQFWVWFGLKTVAGGPPHPFCAQLIFHKLWQMHHAPGYVFAQLVSFNLPTHTQSHFCFEAPHVKTLGF